MQRGLTLLEVLLTALIAVVLLGLTAQGIMRGSEITRIITAQQELLEDIRSAGGLLSDQLAQAVYVYPPGASITFGFDPNKPIADWYWTIKPKSNNSNTWLVGTDPIVAFILPPEDSSQRNQCTPTTLAKDRDPKGCLRFVAFYAIERENVIKNAPSSIRPENNAKNSENWVLYYFSCSMVDVGCGNGPQNTPPDILNSEVAMPSSFASTTGQLLADYINPAGWSVKFLCAIKGDITPTLDDDCKEAYGSLLPLRTAATVELSLQGRITKGSQTSLVPKPPLTIKSSARNLLLP